jgi:hypothetical protein
MEHLKHRSSVIIIKITQIYKMTPVTFILGLSVIFDGGIIMPTLKKVKLPLLTFFHPDENTGVRGRSSEVASPFLVPKQLVHLLL